MLVSAPKIFDFYYPLFDEEYRIQLETKILRHYYTREICAESIGLWKLWLCDRMNMIMPYFNQLYESAKLEFNPLYDVDLTTQHETNSTGDGTTSSTAENRASSTEYELFSDTPQGALTGVDSENYLTNATKNTSNNSSNSTGNVTSTNTATENFTETITGKRGGVTYSKMLKEYRETFLNIDKQVIDSLSDLFITLW